MKQKKFSFRLQGYSADFCIYFVVPYFWNNFFRAGFFSVVDVGCFVAFRFVNKRAIVSPVVAGASRLVYGLETSGSLFRHALRVFISVPFLGGSPPAGQIECVYRNTDVAIRGAELPVSVRA